MASEIRGSGWVESPPIRDTEVDAGEMPTRVVPARLLYRGDYQEERSDGDPSEATVVCSPVSRSDRGAQRPSAEFVPSSGRRPTGEVTIPWRGEGRSGIRRLAERIGKTAHRYRRPGLLVLFAAAVLFVALPRAGSEPPLPVAEGTAVESQNTSPASRGVSEPMEHRESVKHQESLDLEGEATLGRAADALVEGRRAEALAVYRRLVERFPENESFRLATRILERTEN